MLAKHSIIQQGMLLAAQSLVVAQPGRGSCTVLAAPAGCRIQRCSTLTHQFSFAHWLAVTHGVSRLCAQSLTPSTILAGRILVSMLVPMHSQSPPPPPLPPAPGPVHGPAAASWLSKACPQGKGMALHTLAQCVQAGHTITDPRPPPRAPSRMLSNTYPLLPAGCPWLALRVREWHTQGPQETKCTTQPTTVADALHSKHMTHKGALKLTLPRAFLVLILAHRTAACLTKAALLDARCEQMIKCVHLRGTATPLQHKD